MLIPPESPCIKGTGFFPGVKRPRVRVDHQPPFSAEVEGRVEIYICSPLGLRGLFGVNFTFTLQNQASSNSRYAYMWLIAVEQSCRAANCPFRSRQVLVMTTRRNVSRERQKFSLRRFNYRFWDSKSSGNAKEEWIRDGCLTFLRQSQRWDPNCKTVAPPLPSNDSTEPRITNPSTAPQRVKSGFFREGGCNRL